MQNNNTLNLKLTVIGAGAAGNKAVVNLIKHKIIRIDEALLVNTTNRDKPEDFDVEGKFINIATSEDDGGSAKEPKIAEQLTINAIKNETLNLESHISKDTDLVVLIGSLEGGTGNGSIPVMAKYIRDRLGFKVHIMAIKGFSVDARGMDNTINFFKKMQPNYVISCIDNCKFLTEAGNNFKKAEELANKEIANRLWVLRGLGIVPSDQNIDEKELRKIATREGFNNIEYFEIPDDVKIKNNQIFNKLIKDIIDESKSMEISTPSQKCMGIIINLPENEAQYIDLKFPEIKSAYGNPFEIYPHIQWSDAMPKFISFICTGMKLPIDEIKNIIENFKKEFEMVDTSKDTFFDDLKSIQTVPSNLFDLDEAKPTKTSDDDFFNNLFGSDGDDILNNF